MAHEIKPTVYRDAMELSQVALLGSQVDLEKFSIIMNHAVGIKLANAITDAKVSRTIDGASTLTVTVSDPDRNLLQSGNFNNRMDVQVDGLWWRFKSLSKQQDFLTLTFEEREVALLRLYTKPTPMVDRTTMTRAAFILSLIKEVKEIDIPYWIPELHKKQPIFNKNDIAVSEAVKKKGIHPFEKLHVKHGAGSLATPDQIKNAIIILDTGDATLSKTLARRRKLMVCSIMTVIQENSITNKPPYIDDHHVVGCFQQFRNMGWPATGDVATDARAFFQHIQKIDAQQPDLKYGWLCDAVQGAGTPEAFEQWKEQAGEWVDAWGMPGRDKEEKGAASNGQQPDYGSVFVAGYHYYRGLPPSRKNAKWAPESSWTCIQRLADDVNWRAFFVSGTFYYMDEDELFKTEPKAILAEYDDGVDWIDGDYDENKKSASISVQLRMGRYNIPPGSVIKLRDMGPFNGRWIVETVERNMYDPSGTLELKKPAPALAEPRTDQLNAFQKEPSAGKERPVPGTVGQIPIEEGGVIESAKKILQYANKGFYRSESATGDNVAQWRTVRDGKPWYTDCGTYVVCNPKLAQLILGLLDAGWKLGTSALCTDHNCHVSGTNRVSQHALGQAVDIHSLGKVGVGWHNIGHEADLVTQEWVKTVMTQLVSLNPSQIICEGCGGQAIESIAKLQYNDGVVGHFYHVGDHKDHIHVGV